MEITHRPSSIVHALCRSGLCLLAFLAALGASSSACRHRPPPPGPYLAFVANNQSNSVAVVNLASFQVIASIPVAAGPQEVRARPGTRELWVLSDSGKVSILCAPGFQVAATFAVDEHSRNLCFSREGAQAYLLSPVKGDVVFLDAGERKEVARAHATPALGEMILTPDGRTLVASAPEADQLCFFSPETRKLLGSLEVGKGPGPMVVLPDSSKLFVAETEEQKITAVEVGTRRVLSHLELGARPTGLLLKPDGGEIFVLSAPATTLTIVDAFHDNVGQSLPTGRNPVAGIFRRDSSLLYLANAGDGSITALDVANRLTLASIPIGTEPRALALTPDENFLAVADSAASNLALLRADPASLTTGRSALLTTIPVGARPVDIVIPGWTK